MMQAGALTAMRAGKSDELPADLREQLELGLTVGTLSLLSTTHSFRSTQVQGNSEHKETWVPYSLSLSYERFNWKFREVCAVHHHLYLRGAMHYQMWI